MNSHWATKVFHRPETSETILVICSSITCQKHRTAADVFAILSTLAQRFLELDEIDLLKAQRFCLQVEKLLLTMAEEAS